MSRIPSAFTRPSRKALIAYVTVGYPNVEATLSAASYWIMAVFDSEAHIGVDYSDAAAKVDTYWFSYGDPLPTTFGPSLSYYTGDRYNYYLVVE